MPPREPANHYNCLFLRFVNAHYPDIEKEFSEPIKKVELHKWKTYEAISSCAPELTSWSLTECSLKYEDLFDEDEPKYSLALLLSESLLSSALSECGIALPQNRSKSFEIINKQFFICA